MRKKVAGGFMMKGCLELPRVDYQAERPTDVLLSEHPVSELSLSHGRELPKSEVENVGMTFFMSTEWNDVCRVTAVVGELGHHPAVFPEIEGLRFLPRSQIECLFVMADEHAQGRKVNKPYYVDRLWLLCLGSHFYRKDGVKLMPMLQRCRTCGYDRYELLTPEEAQKVHPAWLVPVVAMS